MTGPTPFQFPRAEILALATAVRGEDWAARLQGQFIQAKDAGMGPRETARRACALILAVADTDPADLLPPPGPLLTEAPPPPEGTLERGIAEVRAEMDAGIANVRAAAEAHRQAARETREAA